ncbi:MAG: hypothetical protein HKM02_11420 [Pseudomonadales bacterium]|nr:hypothetical protein [Pseudomonadales bacterium]
MGHLRQTLLGNFLLASMLSLSDELRLQFEAVGDMPNDEHRIVRALLDGMIVKFQTKQLLGGLSI